VEYNDDLLAKRDEGGVWWLRMAMGTRHPQQMEEDMGKMHMGLLMVTFRPADLAEMGWRYEIHTCEPIDPTVFTL
jgi:hypothetical protein